MKHRYTIEQARILLDILKYHNASTLSPSFHQVKRESLDQALDKLRLELADFIATLDGVERVEVLPFHKMGEHKWDDLGLNFHLKDVSPPSPELLNRVIGQFQKRGLFTC